MMQQSISTFDHDENVKMTIFVLGYFYTNILVV